MIKLDKIAKNKYVTLKPFEEKYINKEFIRCLNKKSINRYLEIGKKKQTLKSAVSYLNNIRENNYIYYAIVENINKKLIGTITLKGFKEDSAYIGNMICYKKYFGSNESKTSFTLFLSLVFKNSKIKKIYAGTIKNNLSSNFNLIKNNFKLIKKDGDIFKFLLLKENFKKK